MAALVLSVVGQRITFHLTNSLTEVCWTQTGRVMQSSGRHWPCEGGAAGPGWGNIPNVAKEMPIIACRGARQAGSSICRNSLVTGLVRQGAPSLAPEWAHRVSST